MAEDSHGKEHGSGRGAHGGAHAGGGHGEHEESGAPEWLISFADNVALLMGFFVILLAMNMAKPKAGGIGGEEKFPSAEEAQVADFIISVREAFNHPIDMDSDNPEEAPLRRRMRERILKGETAEPGPDGDRHDVQAVRPSPFVNTGGYVTFADGSDALTADARATLASIAQELRGRTFIIEVRGHVSAPEANLDKAGAMDLSHRRAMAAASHLVYAGARWEQLRVVACADNERATPRAADRHNHRNNQRVEIVVTPETVPPDPYAADDTRAAIPEH